MFQSKSNFSRRCFVKSVGLGAMALGLGGAMQRPMRAQSTTNAAAFYRFQVGDFQMTAIQDGVVVAFPLDFFATNQEPGSVAAAMADANLPTPDLMPTSVNVLLVQTGDRVVLVDTGLGDISFAPDAPPPGGKLLATLELLGLSADSITDVLLTHHHPDHISIISDMQAPTFSNATYHFPQAEYDFIMSGVVTGNEMADGFIQLANGLLAPISDNDQLVLYSAESEPIPGIQILPAPGHTPGHVNVLFNSNGSQMLGIVDIAGHNLINPLHPDWHFALDADPNMAVETRRRLFAMAADDQIPVFAYHFPFPGTGIIDHDVDGFRFLSTL